jgi:hypothetical protein
MKVIRNRSCKSMEQLLQLLVNPAAETTVTVHDRLAHPLAHNKSVTASCYDITYSCFESHSFDLRLPMDDWGSTFARGFCALRVCRDLWR